MSLIEGVGDEVTNFFIIMSVLLVGWFAWCSTNIADQPLIRTVLILRDRTPTRIATLRANHQNTTNTSRPPNLESAEEQSTETVPTNSDDTQLNCSDSSLADSSGEVSTMIGSRQSPEEVLIETMDSFGNDEPSLLQRSTKTSSSDTTVTTPSSNSASSNTASSNTASSNTASSNSASSNSASSNSVLFNTSSDYTTESSVSDENEIIIKLKFINDDQKLVTGSLKEMLGEFKRRHFRMELEAHKSVRLVFNGRVLQPDTQTLEQCGLFNECVVHCWVHQPRPSTPALSSQTPQTLDNPSSIYFNSQSFADLPAGTGISSAHNEWDLSRVLVSILTIILGFAWYSRYHYAQLFTATTTLALYVLTAFFTVSLLSNFFPDQDNVRNVE